MTANKAIWQERKKTAAAAQQNDISLITKKWKIGQIIQLDLMIILEGVQFWKYMEYTFSHSDLIISKCQDVMSSYVWYVVPLF